MRSWNKHLIALLLLFSAWTASAQISGWDAALERYERICEQCIGLRQRSIAGETVSAASISELLGQLASLRNSLQEAAGRMTPSQRARFESIRLRYSEAFAYRSPTSRSLSVLLPPLASPSGLPNLSPSPSAVPGPSSGSALPLIFSGHGVFSGTGQGVPMYPPSVLAAEPRPATGISRPGATRFGMVAFASLPTLRPGLMARLDVGRAGVYLKGSWLPMSDYSYVCKSDGTTSTGFIWTTGKEHVDAYSISAGGSFAVVKTPKYHTAFRLYLGGGYGARSVLWEDASGRWAQVSDLSLSGFSTDAGLLLDIGHLTMMSGISTVAFQAFNLEFGLGFLF